MKKLTDNTYGIVVPYDVNTIEDSIYMQLTLTQTAKELIYGK